MKFSYQIVWNYYAHTNFLHTAIKMYWQLILEYKPKRINDSSEVLKVEPQFLWQFSMKSNVRIFQILASNQIPSRKKLSSDNNLHRLYYSQRRNHSWKKATKAHYNTSLFICCLNSCLVVGKSKVMHVSNFIKSHVETPGLVF